MNRSSFSQAAPQGARRWLACALGTAIWLGHGLATAQGVTEESWQEADVAPPTFQTERLQTFEVSPHSALTFGLDPSTVTIGSDWVVRYVLVARSQSGALNVLFEGIRCKTGELKTYARWNNEQSSWIIDQRAEWRSLGTTRHAARLARDGFCEGPTTNGSVRHMLQSLEQGISIPR